MPHPSDQDTTSTGPLRWVLCAAGLASAALALIGAFLPVLPTTPFLILAAACFVRSSPRFHQRLLANRTFGPYLSQWQRDHTVPPDAKRKAYAMVLLSFAVSIWLIELTWLRYTLVAIGLTLIAFLTRLPTTTFEGAEEDSATPADSPGDA